MQSAEFAESSTEPAVVPPCARRGGIHRVVFDLSVSVSNKMANQESRWLSEKPIPVAERLIFALDVDSVEDAKRLVEKLDDRVNFYKVGLQLFMAGGYFNFLQWLLERDKQSFVDLKFFDVPETVASAVRQLRDRGAAFATVHGNDEILRAAVREKGATKILAVTVLTSLDEADIQSLGFQASVKDVVKSRANFNQGCQPPAHSNVACRLRRNL